MEQRMLFYDYERFIKWSVIWEFIENVNKELKFRLDKNTNNKIKIVVYDNATIHKIMKVKILVKN